MMVEHIRRMATTSLLSFLLVLWININLMLYSSDCFTPSATRASISTSPTSPSPFASLKIDYCSFSPQPSLSLITSPFLPLSTTVLCAETSFSSASTLEEEEELQQYHQQRRQKKKPSNVLPSVEKLLQSDDDPNFETIQRLSELAIYNAENSLGLKALKQLRRLCRRRVPYDFNENGNDGDETVDLRGDL